MNKKNLILITTFIFIILSIMLTGEVKAATEANLEIKLVDQNNNPVVGVEIDGSCLNSGDEKSATTDKNGIATINGIKLDKDSNTAKSKKDIQIDIAKIPTGYEYEEKRYAAQIDLNAALNDKSDGRWHEVKNEEKDAAKSMVWKINR